MATRTYCVFQREGVKPAPGGVGGNLIRGVKYPRDSRGCSRSAIHTSISPTVVLMLAWPVYRFQAPDEAQWCSARPAEGDDATGPKTRSAPGQSFSSKGGDRSCRHWSMPAGTRKPVKNFRQSSAAPLGALGVSSSAGAVGVGPSPAIPPNCSVENTRRSNRRVISACASASGPASKHSYAIAKMPVPSLLRSSGCRRTLAASSSPANSLSVATSPSPSVHSPASTLARRLPTKLISDRSRARFESRRLRRRLRDCEQRDRQHPQHHHRCRPEACPAHPPSRISIA